MNAQLPAQQLRQQRVAQGGKGAGLVEVGADLMEERRHLLIEGEQNFSRREENVSRHEGARGDGVEDGAVTALNETLDEVARVAIERERCADL